MLDVNRLETVIVTLGMTASPLLICAGLGCLLQRLFVSSQAK